MKVSASNLRLNNQNFSGVRQIVQKNISTDVGNFLIQSVKKTTTKDGISSLTRFYTDKGKEIGYHAVGNNGNMLGERLFSNGINLRYWTQITPLGKKKLAVWINTGKTIPNSQSKVVSGFLSADTISKNPKIITTKRGLMDLVIAENKHIVDLAKKLFKNAEKNNLFKDVTSEIL